MVDLHCHLLPYVDDGAETMSVSLRLLERHVRQGVTAVCLTPHLRTGMFETDDGEIRRRFEDLREAARGLPIRLSLSREYYCDSAFLRRLERGALLPIGDRTLLLEFSSGSPAEDILFYTRTVREAGYVPMLAHIERYAALREKGLPEHLKEQGALLTLDAGGLLGRNGFWVGRFCRGLISRGLIDAVASDAHNEERYTPLSDGFAFLERKFGRSTAERLTVINPKTVLTNGADPVRRPTVRD